MSKTGYLKSIILAISFAFVAASVSARPKYMKIYNEDPFSKTENHKKCSICHTDEEDPNKLTKLGEAFSKAEYQFTSELRQQFPDLFKSESSSQSEKEKKPDQTLNPQAGASATGDEVVIEHNGRQLIVNTREKTVREIAPAEGQTTAAQQNEVAAQPAHGKKEERKKEEAKVYRQTDLRLINLPTAIQVPRGSLWNDYTHRWPNGKTTSATTLFGLDSRAVPSFGFTYGVTDRIQVGAYRSSSDLGRPIMVFAGTSLFSEQKGDPLSLLARVALEGQDNFKRNFTTSFELTFARSITRYAQIYLVPTASLGDRPYNTDPTSNAPGVTAFAMGIGGAFRVRPTVSVMAEANYRLNDEARYILDSSGIRRPVIGFGIQKSGVSRRHTYSLTFTNGPGTTFSQRSMTRGLQGSDDTFRGLTIGFNLTRRIF